MKILTFGGANKSFIKEVCEGFDTTHLGRDTVDYTDVNSFIENLSEVPDTVVFNIANNGHQMHKPHSITGDEDFNNLHLIIDTTFRFQLNFLEWLFNNHSNKRVLWITSMEPYNIGLNDPRDYDGDLLLYRMTRALEHQAIHQQNANPANKDKNNIVMGICVAHNYPGTTTILNNILRKDLFYRNVVGIDESPSKLNMPVICPTLCPFDLNPS